MVYVIHHYTGATAKRKADLILGIGVLFQSFRLEFFEDLTVYLLAVMSHF